MRKDSTAIVAAIVSLARALRLRRSPRASRPPSSSSSCGRWAARSARASCSGPRARPRTSDATRLPFARPQRRSPSEAKSPSVASRDGFSSRLDRFAAFDYSSHSHVIRRIRAPDFPASSRPPRRRHLSRRKSMPATLTIKPWPDPVIDTLGHDPRSRYVETFWLPTLGPTALLLLRHLADRFDRDPDGVELTVVRHVARARARPARRQQLADRAHACAASRSSTSRARTRCPTRSRCGATSRRSTARHLRRLPRDAAARARRMGRAAARRSADGRGAPPRPARRVHAARAGRRPRPRRAGAARDRLPPRAVPRERAVGVPTVTARRSSTSREPPRRRRLVADPPTRSRFELAPVLAAAAERRASLPEARRSPCVTRTACAGTHASGAPLGR